ncbi:uncharacterized protein [Coffea arabica]|uniref:RNase H type-1 domain-containing protein n=1 Tax=Coffea arabica TaxID=13443 RepID=A0ABM4VSU6_COFAR
MMFNPKKCLFGVFSKKFLGYYVARRDIEVNPDKVKAIQKMSSPQTPRDVQRLTGWLAVLNRFLSQSATKALLFFKVLKKIDKFSWIEECYWAFEQMKDYLHHLPTLTSSRAGETLYLYLSAGEEAVRAVLIQDDGAQALADFLVELTFPTSQEATPEDAEPQKWTLYVDGSSNSDGSGAGLLLKDSHGEACSYALRFDFTASNNEVEYEAVIAGLQLARRLGAQRISVYSNSQLVVCQVLEEYEAREKIMQWYLSKVHQLVAYFKSFEIQRIPRSQNRRDDKVEARKVQRKSARYVLCDGNLYKRSYLGPWLRCITTEEGEDVLKDIHEGFCGAYIGYRMLVKKTRLHQFRSSWVDEFPSVLWSYQTTLRSATQETPFSLTYRSEAMVPAEFLTPSSRIKAFTAESNEEQRRIDLDLVEEKRDAAAARVALYKNILASYYNVRVRYLRFSPGDLVLRKNLVSRSEPQGI